MKGGTKDKTVLMHCIRMSYMINFVREDIKPLLTGSKIFVTRLNHFEGPTSHPPLGV
ncbi:hypothetical protein RSAG8_03802, partial [Rhizoctonia solani AG-8 WAC10335]